MTTHVELDLENEDIIHFIGFIAICEMSGSPFVRNAAERSKKVLMQAIGTMPYIDFDKAVEIVYKQIQVDRVKIAGFPNIDYSKFPLFNKKK